MSAPLRRAIEHPDLLIGWVRADGVEVAPSDAKLCAALEAVAGDPARQGLEDASRTAIRDLLRGRGYKPSGRGKPANEFLVAAAGRGDFPLINNVVDINNLLSLETGWPISVFDAVAARGDAPGLEVRYAEPGESFVFNAAGQSIDLGGLVVVARVGGAAIGNPVKDSMATKIGESTRSVLAVLYASAAVAAADRVAAAAARYADLLARHAGAEEIASGVLTPD